MKPQKIPVKNLLIFSNQIQLDPPQADEIEISLFGPGVGECVVVHIGNNEWFVIDSCLESTTKRPVPLVYLDKLNILPHNAIKLIIISHWHSDHIQGASQIFKECTDSIICFSEVFLKEEFLSLVSAYSGLDRPSLVDRETCGTKEIALIIRILKERLQERKKFPDKPSPYILASADQRIYQSKDQNIPKELWALSPSTQTKMNSLIEISTLMPSASNNEDRRLIPKPDQNHNAIALQLKFGDVVNMLLGSDLEETDDPLTGWSVIVQSTNRPLDKSIIFKIPHHGSENGHSDDVWKNMLHNDCLAILTTKIGGRANTPKRTDIERIKKYTQNLCCTLEPKGKRQKRDTIVEKTIKGIMKKRIPLNGEMGHIQIRFKVDTDIAINLKEPAIKL